MPLINADGCPIHVEVAGPERAPVLMLSNSLGTTLNMWDRQVAPFIQHFRLVRYDPRGHGRSGVPNGPYTMSALPATYLPYWTVSQPLAAWLTAPRLYFDRVQ